VPAPPTRERAIRILDEGHREVARLAARLSPADVRRPATMGGGDWSVKDLLGHLTSWDEHALGALAAWRRGQPAPIQRALRGKGLNAVNAAAIAADRRRTAPDVLRRFDEIHRRLIREIRAVPARAWSVPPTARARRPLGEALGRVLGGPDGYFAHAQAHAGDLRAYVRTR
jgi:Mycothiol maleylpyruvate isomerase N-terminal domain